MLTRAERRYSGSQHVGLTKIPSTLSAAAERKIAPTFVWSTIPSSTHTRTGRSPAASTTPPKNSSTGICRGRRNAASAPRVTLKPVSCSMSSMEATNTGTGPAPSRTTRRSNSGIIWSSQRSPKRKLTGSYPARTARSITLALSAIKMPFCGSSTQRSSRSVSRT